MIVFTNVSIWMKDGKIVCTILTGFYSNGGNPATVNNLGGSETPLCTGTSIHELVGEREMQACMSRLWA